MATRRPLVVTADELLLDDILRLAATAGVQVEAAADPGSARPVWSAAAVVVLGDDALSRCVAARLPRRSGVVVVSRGEPDPAVWRQAVAVGAEQVHVLPDAEPALVRQLAESIEGGADEQSEGRLLCCIGGSGGAGASVLAAGLALTAARELRRPTLLVDLDPFGGGLDLTLGGEEVGGLRWPELGATTGRVSATSLREALPTVGGVTVLSTAREQPDDIAEESVRAVLAAARRAGELAIADLPRALTPAARAVLGVADRVLLVVPARVRAAAAAASTAAALSGWTDRTEVVVRYSARSTLDAETMSRSLGLPIAGTLRSEPGLVALLDRGEPPIRRGRGPLAALCRQLLAEVPSRRGRHHEEHAA